MSFYDAIRVGASGAGDFEVERSLRFNDGDSTHLSRTPSSAGNRRTFTWSAWIKRGELGATQGRCFGGGVSGSDYFEIYFPSDDGLRVIWYQGGQTLTTTTANFRDPSAWYHFVVAVDTTQSTAGDRIKMYRNNVLLERIQSDPSQNLDTSVNNTVEHNIGKYLTGNASYFDGYMAEVNFIDGLQLTPSSFAETNSDTGQWVPKDTSALTFGTNGFRLIFSDNSGTTATTLGKDSSGNGNNFTPNNFSVSAGAGNDSLEDTPTNNFATMNPLVPSPSVTWANGNLDLSGSSGTAYSQNNTSTFGVSSGKWYVEVKYTFGGTNNVYVGICPITVAADANMTGSVTDAAVLRMSNETYIEGTSASSGTSISSGDIIGIALDMDNNKVWFSVQGTYISSGNPSTGANATFDGITAGETMAICGRPLNGTLNFNFGQRAFTYTPPTGFKKLNSANLPDPTILLPEKHYNTLVITGNQSTNAVTGLDFQPDWVVYKALNPETGHGETWFHDAIKGPTVRQGIRPYNTTTPPAEVTNSSYLVSFDSNGLTVGNDGVYNNYHQYNQTGRLYQALCWDAGETDGATYTVKVVSDSGNKYRFNDFGTSAVTLDLAEGGTYTFDGSDSSMSGHPFVIGTAANGSVYSTGVTYQLDGASVTYSAYTSGYSSATTRKLIITVPASAPQLYYWCSIHSGMGGAINTNSTLGSSNFDGSLQATVKANTTAGFSIGTYTAQSSGSATVGHGLGVAPDVVITKSRTVTSNWYSYHQAIGQDGWIFLNDHAAATTGNSAVWNPAPTSSVFTYGSGLVNFGDVVFYAFSEVAGYSKFGSYTGNGNADRPFIFTGFRPAWIMIKRTNSSEGWQIFDNKRSPINEIGDVIEANTNAAAVTSIPNWLDFLSNGIKLRAHYTNGNGSGSTYIYLAFAESPFKNSRAR